VGRPNREVQRPEACAQRCSRPKLGTACANLKLGLGTRGQVEDNRVLSVRRRSDSGGRVLRYLAPVGFAMRSPRDWPYRLAPELRFEPIDNSGGRPRPSKVARQSSVVPSLAHTPPKFTRVRSPALPTASAHHTSFMDVHPAAKSRLATLWLHSRCRSDLLRDARSAKENPATLGGVVS
jgi:hypothetical protein